MAWVSGSRSKFGQLFRQFKAVILLNTNQTRKGGIIITGRYITSYDMRNVAKFDNLVMCER